VINQLNNPTETTVVLLRAIFCDNICTTFNAIDRAHQSHVRTTCGTIKIIHSPCKSWLLKRSETESINEQLVQSIHYTYGIHFARFRAMSAIEIQKLPDVRKLSKRSPRELASHSTPFSETFPLDYHKNFFDARIATPRVAREKRKRILRIFVKTSPIFISSRERLAVWCTKASPGGTSQAWNLIFFYKNSLEF